MKQNGLNTEPRVQHEEQAMDVKEAINKAKDYVKDIFGGEGILNLGLEEIEFNDGTDEWLVTVGFSRPWNSARNALTALTGEQQSLLRTYKVVRLKDRNGEIISVKRREKTEDA